MASLTVAFQGFERTRQAEALYIFVKNWIGLMPHKFPGVGGEAGGSSGRGRKDVSPTQSHILAKLRFAKSAKSLTSVCIAGLGLNDLLKQEPQARRVPVGPAPHLPTGTLALP